MAQYIVRSGSSYYANRSLIKSIHSVGEAGLTLCIARGDIKTHVILGRVVFSIPKETVDRLVGRQDIRFQDIDSMIGDFTNEGCEGAKKHVVECGEEYQLNTIRFMQLRDIEDESTRYRSIKDMPYIEFLGYKYVALDVRVKGKDCRVVTTASKQ